MSWIFSTPLTVAAVYVAFCVVLFSGLIFFSETWTNDEVDH